MTKPDVAGEGWTAGEAGLFDTSRHRAGRDWSMVLGVAPPGRTPLAQRLVFVTACRHEAVLAAQRLTEADAAFLVLVEGNPEGFATWLLAHDCELALLVLAVGEGEVAGSVDTLFDVANGAPPGDVAAWRRRADLDWVVHRDRLRVLVPAGAAVAEGRWEVLSRQLGLALRRLPMRTNGYRVVGQFGGTSTRLLVDRHPPDADLVAVRVSGDVAVATRVPVTELDSLASWLLD